MCTTNQIWPPTLTKSCNCELGFPSNKLTEPFASHVGIASVKNFRPSTGQILISVLLCWYNQAINVRTLVGLGAAFFSTSVHS